jgi:TolA-binding protein
MKRQERHKLKENEFARSVAHAQEVFATRKQEILWGVTLAVVLLAIVGGYTWWRQARNARATALLANALAIYQAPVVPPPAPAPGSPAPVQQPGTYPTEQAKLQAALPKFIETVDRYPSSQAGIVARYHAAGILATLGRYAEAEQRYQEVVTNAGGSLYARTARLGLADAQVAQKKFDSAINIFTELTRNTASEFPADGVLMQLGRACALAGRKEEAVRAFTRVVDDFPQSPYASDAKRELEEVKKS